MVENLQQEKSLLVKQSAAQNAAIKYSFVVAHKIVRQSKIFTEGEFLKDCMITVADTICPESKNKFKSIPLLRRTVVRHAEAIPEHLVNFVLTSNHFGCTH